AGMDVRLIDLDGSLPRQLKLRRQFAPTYVDLRRWGPRVRLACTGRRFARFTDVLRGALGAVNADDPPVVLYGSGDFHHVTLALLRLLDQPVNLLVLDNHPDWMRGVPFMHCGTWLWHAARLRHVERIFHVGGDVD